MAGNNAALDEISYARPEIIHWWVSEGGQPMDENMIHRYFSESPFFDWSSKNGLFMQQAGLNFEMHMMSRNRKAFEDALKAASGVEYLIVGEPQPVPVGSDPSGPKTTGIWTIRKQDRRAAPADKYVRPPGVIQDGEWELTVLGTYFIVGETVFQAPNLADVVGNRLLSATTSMNKFFDMAAALPHYTPATGYTYLSSSTQKQPGSGQYTGLSPSQSREGSVAPGADLQSVRSTSMQPDSQPEASLPSKDIQDARLFENSLRMALQFGDEYTDENPLVGEPGSFKFSATTTAISKRRAEEEEALLKARAKKETTTGTTSSQATASQKAAAAPPPAVFSESKVGGAKQDKNSKEERRMSKAGDKIKRRKSRPGGSGLSPVTTSGTSSPLATSSSA